MAKSKRKGGKKGKRASSKRKKKLTKAQRRRIAIRNLKKAHKALGHKSKRKGKKGGKRKNRRAKGKRGGSKRKGHKKGRKKGGSKRSVHRGGQPKWIAAAYKTALRKVQYRRGTEGHRPTEGEQREARQIVNAMKGKVALFELKKRKAADEAAYNF